MRSRLAWFVAGALVGAAVVYRLWPEEEDAGPA